MFHRNGHKSLRKKKSVAAVRPATDASDAPEIPGAGLPKKEGHWAVSEVVDALQLPSVCFDANAIITEFNAAAARMIGLRHEPLPGSSFASLLVAQDVPAFLAHLRRCRLQTAQPVITTVRLETMDKPLRIDLVSVSIPGVKPLFRTALINVASRDTGLSASSLPELVMDMLESPLIVLNGRLEILRANKAFQRVFHAREVQNLSIFNLPRVEWLGSQFRDVLTRSLEYRVPLEPVMVDVRFSRPEAHLTFVISIRKVRDPVAGVSVLMLHFQNVTSRIEAETDRERSFRELQSVSEELEVRVMERTLELQEANTRLQHLSKALVEAQENERRHLARELHDQIGQELTSLNFMLNELSRSPESARDGKLAEARDAVSGLMRQVRQLSIELRPHVLDDLGLKAALRWHVKQLRAHTGLRIHLETKGLQEKRLPHHMSVTLFRLIQESLNNIVKHSGATAVSIRLNMDKSQIGLAIQDNGQGFGARKPHQVQGFGLMGMQERVELIGGKFQISSMPGKGARTTATMPLTGKTQSDARTDRRSVTNETRPKHDRQTLHQNSSRRRS